MSLGPRFSANKLQTVLRGALGGGSDSVQKALVHIGAQKVLKTGATTKDAKVIMRKLQASGAIKDDSHARAVFKQAERVADAADRMRVRQTKEDRLKEFDASRKIESLAQSIVDAHQHGTSIIGDKNIGQHYNSIADALKKPVMGKTSTGLAGAAPATKPLLDIPFD